jgi:hypothetical protein
MKINNYYLANEKLFKFCVVFLFYCLFYSLILIGFLNFPNFWIFRAHLNRDFIFQDLWAILWLSEHLDKFDESVYLPIEEFGGTGYTNGYFGLVFLSSLGMKVSHFIPISVILIILMLYVFSYITFQLNHQKIKIKYTILVFCSPVIWFLFERLNTDIIIVILLFFATSLFRKHELVSFFIIFFTVLLKHYTIPILFLFPFITKKRVFRYIYILISFLALLIFIKEWLMITYEKPWTLISSFGVTNSGIWINKVSQFILNQDLLASKYSEYIFGLSLFLFFTYLICRYLKHLFTPLSDITYIPANNFLNYFLLFSSITHIFTYIAPSSVYDYKLVFFLFSGVLLLYGDNNKSLVKFQPIFLVALWTSGWGYHPNDYLFILLQFISDICIFVFSCIILIHILITLNFIDFKKKKL